MSERENELLNQIYVKLVDADVTWRYNAGNNKFSFQLDNVSLDIRKYVNNSTGAMAERIKLRLLSPTGEVLYHTIDDEPVWNLYNLLGRSYLGLKHPFFQTGISLETSEHEQERCNPLEQLL